jgi:hypothetical protein
MQLRLARLAGLLTAATCLCASAAATTLYDPSLGTLPTSQGWSPLLSSIDSSSTQSVSGGLYRLATAAGESDPSVWGRLSPTALDTAAGFNFDIDLRIVDEAHDSPNRAGFSFILTGASPSHSIEVAFWKDRVFAYAYDASDPDRFVHGVEALFDTASASHDYTLSVQNQQFSLSTAGQTLLSGSLVDYRNQGLPYTLPSAIFFGDDTSRGSASIEVGAISLSPVPEPAGWVLAGLGLAVITFRRQRR